MAAVQALPLAGASMVGVSSSNCITLTGCDGNFLDLRRRLLRLGLRVEVVGGIARAKFWCCGQVVDRAGHRAKRGCQ